MHTECFPHYLYSLNCWILMYSKNNVCLWSTLLQGGLKAVVWTDVFQVGTTLNSLLDL